MNQALRIAIADDEEDMREYFRWMLARLGFQVVAAAASGRELVEQVRALHPDLVISDIMMPDMDGLEAIETLAADKPVPVILVTANSDPKLLERAEVNHVVGYLVKPIKQTDLEPVIAQAMQRFAAYQYASPPSA